MFYPKKKKKLKREDLDRVMDEIRQTKRQAEEAPPPAPPVSSSHQEIHIHNHPASGGQENSADADLKRLLERTRWFP